MDEGGSRDGASLFEESLRRGPCRTEGNMESWGGGSNAGDFEK